MAIDQGLQLQGKFHLYRSVITTAAVVAALIIAGLAYLNRPAPKGAPEQPASAEATAYLPNLELSDVNMKATENFMKQQVVEIEGRIRNKGPRAIDSVEVYCLFSDVGGREIYREKAAVVQAKGAPLRPGEVRAFRLPFDSLPDAWNQAMPKMVIAQIKFAQ